ncbi:MAG TPA: phosphatase PAP2 family protein, partial [Flavisolibacter sp.]|nr:phosphatase PAP2 family protein [Flavisolibacter sp.]
MEQIQTVAKKAKGISLRFLVVAGIFLLALLVFSVIANEIVFENETGFDRLVFQRLAAITSPAMTSVMVFITFFGSSYFLLPAYILLILYFLLFRKNTRLSLDVASVGITSTIILFSLKAIFHRHRPLDPLVKNVNGFSFPSGHSFSSFTFFGLLVYILWNHEMNPVLRWVLTIVFAFIASAIAFSRIYLHVHFASDVIAGLCLCIVWLGISLWMLKKLNRKLS